MNLEQANMKFKTSKIRYYLFLGTSLGLFTIQNSTAQIFKCDVTINTDRIENTAFSYLPQLKPAIEEYFNRFEWIEDRFEEQEFIECQMQIIFNSADQNFNFSAEIILSTRRPIYNTLQKTSTFIINDQFWQFSYPEGTNLIHDDLQFNPLTSFLDFYAYIMLGYDYDTFSRLGGNPHFTKAQTILDLAQNAGSSGWDRNTNNRRNRFFLITDLLNPSYEDLRQAHYQYYRLGLDSFTTNPEAARRQIADAIKIIRDAKRRNTNNYLFDLFFDAKSREISSIFDEAIPRLKLEVYNVLLEADQGHLSDYQNLQN